MQCLIKTIILLYIILYIKFTGVGRTGLALPDVPIFWGLWTRLSLQQIAELNVPDIFATLSKDGFSSKF